LLGVRQLFRDDFAGLVNLISPELQPKVEGWAAKCPDTKFS
jgi:hypothetical protein